MTERYDILNIIEKELLHQTELFGDLQKVHRTIHLS